MRILLKLANVIIIFNENNSKGTLYWIEEQYNTRWKNVHKTIKCISR